MSRGTSPEAGFSLAELLVALGLTGMVISSVVGLQATALRHFRITGAKCGLEAQATFAAQSLQASLARSSEVIVPAQGNVANQLTGYVNVDPATLSGPILSGLPAEYFHYCTAGSPAKLYKYTGVIPMAAIACGTGSAEIIAGGQAVTANSR